MLQRLYDWTMDLAGKPNALLFLVLIAFVESSFFPLPPDILLIPMVLAAREQAWRYAAFCTAASVLGGCAGYGIGYFLFDTIGQPVLGFYGYMDKFEVFKGYYNEWGAWIVAGAGVTPFPYKVITIASGVTNLDFATFSVASVLSRGARFFLVAALLWKFGPPIRGFIEQHLGKLTVIFFVILIGSFVIIKYL
ncbi:MAG: DedA family protein [Rhodospirillales bacterium]|nr:DedA family protein [Rhodospirillales bacterium]